MSGPGAQHRPAGPDASRLPGERPPERPGSIHGGEARRAAPKGEPEGLRALAARLDAIGLRARVERWPGFTAEDARIIGAAARELATFEDALAEGMREAFAIGREHREREALLNRLNEEIAIATSRLAREAWGARRRGPDG